MKKQQLLFGGLGLVLGWSLLRKYLLHWGARPAEKRYQSSPIPAASSRAITIQAAPDQVFAWLQQIGYQRAGFYSYQRLERLLGLPIVNAEQIQPQWQQVAAGDSIGIAPSLPAQVLTYQPGRELSLGFGYSFLRFHWAFLLMSPEKINAEPSPNKAQSTRLLVQTSVEGAAWAQFIWCYLLEPLHAVMEIGLLKGLKQRAER